MSNATPRLVAPAPIQYETAEHVVCEASTPGAIPFVAGGLQPDGTFLYKLDIDGHHDDQDPDRVLDYGKRHKPDLFARLVIRRSAGLDGHRPGYHLPIRTTIPLFTVKIYDPWGVYAGEICDRRIEVDTCAYDAIPLLSVDELRQLLYYIPAPGAMGEARAEGSAAAIDSLRKERIAEGEPLIAGYKTIRDWRAQLDAACDRYPQLARRRAELRTSVPGGDKKQGKKDRTSAYGQFVQSLMLHAIPFGTSTEARCTMIAAMAIGTGANGKEQDGDYRIERDTAALIAKILHGDRYESPNSDGTYARWTIPAWAKGQALPKVEPAPAVEPAPRQPTNHATQRRDLRLAAIRRKLSAIEPDAFGRRRFLIERISAAPRRTTQADLKWLRDHGEIATGQIDGNGAPYAVLTAQFGGAKPCKKADSAALNPADLWGASAEPAQRTAMAQTADRDALCNKVEGAPKSSAPAVELGGPSPRPQARNLLGAPLPAPAGASDAEPAGASYDPTFGGQPDPRFRDPHYCPQPGLRAAPPLVEVEQGAWWGVQPATPFDQPPRAEAMRLRTKGLPAVPQARTPRLRSQRLRQQRLGQSVGALPTPTPYRSPMRLPLADLPDTVRYEQPAAPVVDQGEAMRQSLFGALKALHQDA